MLNAPLKRFQCRGPDKPTAPNIPKARDLVVGSPTTLKPTDTVVAQIGGAVLVAGLDIETHGWEDRTNQVFKGRFGFFHLCHPDDMNQRIVQIGWAIGKANAGVDEL